MVEYIDNMKKAICFLVFATLLFSCKKKVEQTKVNTENDILVYQEPYRPQYHFSPPKSWMNDPNGLVFNEGIYHLFYQYYPDDIVWGPMHWGHATSKDMMHWQHKPIALYPDEHGLIFSGSAVVDKKNTSGFGENGKTPLVAIYTYHLMEGEKAGRDDFQTQGIAYSLDNGDTWVKYEGNPVIGNEGIRDFRDPKVFWHDQTESWILALVAGDHAKFYRSTNLKEWVHISDFGVDNGAHGGVWECPDLFPLKVEGTDEEKWVLIISINPGAPNGGSGTQYFIGDFDGTSFTAEHDEVKWLDWGTDNYAGVTYNNTPNDERIFIGWMSNWNYARDTPTEKWRSAMTLPRNLTLHSISGELVLKNYPLNTIASLAETSKAGTLELESEQSTVFETNNLSQSEIKFTTSARDFQLTLGNKVGDELKLMFDASKKQVFLDRTKSGKVDFQEDFGNVIHKMPMDNLPEGEIEVRIFLDWSSIEVFINKGQYVMTQQVFPKEFYTDLIVQNTGKDTIRLKDTIIQQIKSVW